MFSSKRSRVIAAGAAAVVLATVTACSSSAPGTAAASSAPASASAAATSSPAGRFGSGGGANARSGPAAQVIVQPPSTSGSNPGGQVIGYTKGKQGSTAKVGQIPADYSQGSGALVSGTTADKAIEAALAAYPGGVINRVVALGNGQYEVHCIGINWPHHIFVNKDFQVIGADD